MSDRAAPAPPPPRRPAVGFTVKPGDRLAAAQVNEIVGAVNRIAGGVAPPFVIDDPTSTTTRVQQFRVKEALGDYLTCWVDDGATSSIPAHTDQPTVRVAKPWLLRRTPFTGRSRAGITYTYDSATARTAADEDGHEEDQVIVPSYEEGDVVYAAALSVVVRIVPADPKTDETVAWLDLNVDGRAWGSA